MAHHLTPVIQIASVMTRKASVAAESRERVGCAVAVPKHGMGFQQVVSAVRVEWRATAGGAHCLAFIIEAGGDSVRVARRGAQLLHYAIPPHDGHKAVHGTALLRLIRFGKAGY